MFKAGGNLLLAHIYQPASRLKDKVVEHLREHPIINQYEDYVEALDNYLDGLFNKGNITASLKRMRIKVKKTRKCIKLRRKSGKRF